MTRKIFYVGKGKDLRYEAHEADAMKSETDKKKEMKIWEIKDKGNEVIIILLARNLDSKEALLIESNKIHDGRQFNQINEFPAELANIQAGEYSDCFRPLQDPGGVWDTDLSGMTKEAIRKRHYDGLHSIFRNIQNNFPIFDQDIKKTTDYIMSSDDPNSPFDFHFRVYIPKSSNIGEPQYFCTTGAMGEDRISYARHIGAQSGCRIKDKGAYVYAYKEFELNLCQSDILTKIREFLSAIESEVKAYESR